MKVGSGLEIRTFGPAARAELADLGLNKGQVELLERNGAWASGSLAGRAPVAEVRDSLRDVERRAKPLLATLTALIAGHAAGTREAGLGLNYFITHGPSGAPRFDSVEVGHPACLEAVSEQVKLLLEASRLAQQDIAPRRRERDTTSPMLITLMQSALVEGADAGQEVPPVSRNASGPSVRIAALFFELVYGIPGDPDRAMRAYLEQQDERKRVEREEGNHSLDDDYG